MLSLGCREGDGLRDVRLVYEHGSGAGAARRRRDAARRGAARRDAECYTEGVRLGGDCSRVVFERRGAYKASLCASSRSSSQPWLRFSALSSLCSRSRLLT